MITCDGASASHELVKKLDKLASRRGYQVIYSVGWALTGREKVALSRRSPRPAWEAAIDGRARSASAATMTPARTCGAPPACWI